MGDSGNPYHDAALRLNAIIDTAIDGIITIDRRGIIESINPSGAHLFQYDPEELVGSNISVLMPEPDRSNHDSYLSKYQETGHARIIGIGREVKGRKKDGTTFPFRLAVSQVDLKDRFIYTGIIHDLTEINAAREKILNLNEALEQKVEQRTNQLEEVVNKLLKTNSILKEREMELKVTLEKEKELNELKSRFVSMASHEFRTPLSTINSSASLIKHYTHSDQNDKRLKHINRIHNSVDILTQVLNDFLNLSKLEEGNARAKKSYFSVDSLCEEILDSIQAILKKGQNINYTLQQEGMVIYTDKYFLKNILFNLFSNAIKYSHEDTEIRCNVKSDRNYTIFTITDQGIGIPLTEQKYMFERFFRASNAENIQGTGLGLNIVKSYLDLLNGDIGFESEVGKGTSFTIRIPNAKENE